MSKETVTRTTLNIYTVITVIAQVEKIYTEIIKYTTGLIPPIINSIMNRLRNNTTYFRGYEMGNIQIIVSCQADAAAQIMYRTCT